MTTHKTIPVTSTGTSVEPPLLSLSDLRVFAGSPGRGEVLVDGVSLSVSPGESVGIVGESGSGKSLLAKAIVGLLPSGVQATGSAVFDGTEMVAATEKALRSVRGTRVSLLMQDPFTMLNPLQRIGESIRESLRPNSDRGREGTAAEIVKRLDEVGLSAEVARSFPFELSGGMCQRAALAAALAGDPDLLLADEPTTALDVTTQAEMLSLLASVQERRGMALLLITHDLSVAFTVCHRVAVLYAGSVVELGPARELQEAPRHPYTLGLLESEVSAHHYTSQLSFIPGSVPKAHTVTTRCAFADRCSWVQEECTSRSPELVAIDAQRWSACRRVDDLTAVMDRRRAEAAVGSEPPTIDTSSPVVLSVSELRKSYRVQSMIGRTRTTAALKGVSFDIRATESVGLIGESGSGKTTIARAILGLLDADSGTLEVDGLDAFRQRKMSRADRRLKKQSVQMVFQDPFASLNPNLTLGTVLNEALSFRRAEPGQPPSAEQLLDMVGLPQGYVSRLPQVLSGGERQRVAIARAIAVRPKLLVCDEPVAALDVSVQAQVLELLRAIREKERMAMLFITHDLSVVRQMCERVIVLYRGEIVEAGVTAEVLDDPQHPYTARLMASSPEATATTMR